MRYREVPNTKPWRTFQRNGKWKVYKVDADGQPTGEAVGTHDTEGEAEDQVMALRINVHKTNRTRVSDNTASRTRMSDNTRKLQGTPLIAIYVVAGTRSVIVNVHSRGTGRSAASERFQEADSALSFINQFLRRGGQFETPDDRRLYNRLMASVRSAGMPRRSTKPMMAWDVCRYAEEGNMAKVRRANLEAVDIARDLERRSILHILNKVKVPKNRAERDAMNAAREKELKPFRDGLRILEIVYAEKVQKRPDFKPWAYGVGELNKPKPRQSPKAAIRAPIPRNPRGTERGVGYPAQPNIGYTGTRGDLLTASRQAIAHLQDAKRSMLDSAGRLSRVFQTIRDTRLAIPIRKAFALADSTESVILLLQRLIKSGLPSPRKQDVRPFQPGGENTRKLTKEQARAAAKELLDAGTCLTLDAYTELGKAMYVLLDAGMKGEIITRLKNIRGLGIDNIANDIDRVYYMYSTWMERQLWNRIRSAEISAPRQSARVQRRHP